MLLLLLLLLLLLAGPKTSVTYLDPQATYSTYRSKRPARKLHVCGDERN